MSVVVIQFFVCFRIKYELAVQIMLSNLSSRKPMNVDLGNFILFGMNFYTTDNDYDKTEKYSLRIIKSFQFII